MMRFRVTVLFMIAALAMLACGEAGKPANVATNTTNTAAPVGSPLPSATIDELASGRKVYEQSCAGCHKEDGTGGKMTIEGKTIDADDLTSEKIKGFSDEKILGYIINGVEDEGMPAFKGKLTEGEMRDVVKFIRSELQKMPVSKS